MKSSITNLQDIIPLFNSEGESLVVIRAGCWHILDEVHITNIAVSSNCRQKKIWRSSFLKDLLMIVMQQKNKIHYARSKSQQHCSNQFIYTKYGFSSFWNKRKGYYQDNNEDAIIMWTKNIFF